MTRQLWAAVLLIGSGLAGPAKAYEVLDRTSCRGPVVIGQLWNPCCRHCPDDYCPKPLPWLACPMPVCGCDDYARKPLPPCPPRSLLGCDDYCPKGGFLQPAIGSGPAYRCPPPSWCAPR